MCNLCHETISMCLNEAENMRQQQYLVERDIQKYMAEYEVSGPFGGKQPY